jgi:hypothetical protein
MDSRKETRKGAPESVLDRSGGQAINTMSYKGYEAIVEYNEDAEHFHGEVMKHPGSHHIPGSIGRRTQGRSGGIG